MIESGRIVYVLLVVILFMFWRKTRGLSFDELLERSAREHHDVLHYHKAHPRGASWPKHRDWMRRRVKK